MSYTHPINHHVSVDDTTAIVVVERTPTVRRPSVHVEIRGPPTLEARIRPSATIGDTNLIHLRVSRAKKAFKEAVRAALVNVGITHFPIFHRDHRIRLCAEFGVSDATKDVQLMGRFLADALRGVLYRDMNMIFDQHGRKVLVDIGEEYTQFWVELDS